MKIKKLYEYLKSFLGHMKNELFLFFKPIYNL